MDFKIETGVPYAPARGGRGRKPTAFPFAHMEVGDSFTIPCDNTKSALDSWRRKLATAKKSFNKGHEDVWDFRSAYDEKAAGLRVWRVESQPAVV